MLPSNDRIVPARNANYKIETYEPLKPVWTWYVPERYVVHEAYLETKPASASWISKTTPCTWSPIPCRWTTL
jgi:hypothetical protein